MAHPPVPQLAYIVDVVGGLGGEHGEACHAHCAALLEHEADESAHHLPRVTEGGEGQLQDDEAG